MVLSWLTERRRARGVAGPFPEAWEATLRADLAHWRHLDDAERALRALDPYAATDEAELFAVATKSFFERPATLARELPKLYALLADDYRQGPAARMAHGPREDG